jgi:hypothetical protein
MKAGNSLLLYGVLILLIAIVGFYLVLHLAHTPTVGECFMLTTPEDRKSCFSSLNVTVDEHCESIEDVQGRETCYVMRRKLGVNASESCDVLSGYDRGSCYSELAVLQRKPALCKNWDDPFFKFMCLGDVAAESGDPKVCNLIPDGVAIWHFRPPFDSKIMKDFCFVAVAVTTYPNSKDTSLCDRIGDKEINVYCKALVLNKPALCLDISSSFRKNKCIADVPTVQWYRKTRNPYTPKEVGMAYLAVYTLGKDSEDDVRLW